MCVYFFSLNLRNYNFVIHLKQTLNNTFLFSKDIYRLYNDVYYNVSNWYK